MLWTFLFIRLTRTNYNSVGISRNRLCTAGSLWQEQTYGSADAEEEKSIVSQKRKYSDLRFWTYRG